MYTDHSGQSIDETDGANPGAGARSYHGCPGGGGVVYVSSPNECPKAPSPPPQSRLAGSTASGPDENCKHYPGLCGKRTTFAGLNPAGITTSISVAVPSTTHSSGDILSFDGKPCPVDQIVGICSTTSSSSACTVKNSKLNCPLPNSVYECTPDARYPDGKGGWFICVCVNKGGKLKCGWIHVPWRGTRPPLNSAPTPPDPHDPPHRRRHHPPPCQPPKLCA
jgi:hypothetical protein